MRAAHLKVGDLLDLGVSGEVEVLLGVDDALCGIGKGREKRSASGFRSAVAALFLNHRPCARALAARAWVRTTEEVLVHLLAVLLGNKHVVRCCLSTVSYTHLTLPTICSV